jgi:uncharacterized protein (DUF1697 family)
MSKWLLLLRGINVSGHNIIKMIDLKKMLENKGLRNVKTYIQSGNVVFESENERDFLMNQIAEGINEEFSVNPKILLLTKDEFESAVCNSPYTEEALNEGKSVHVYFMSSKPSLDKINSCDKYLSNGESIKIEECILYFHAPNGIGQSVFARKMEGLLDVDTTGRNWNTISKIATMLQH